MKKSNKRKILLGMTTGIIIIGGVTYIIVNQQLQINKNSKDIQLLKDVINGNVIHSLRQTYLRKLRYNEGKLKNSIDIMTEKDIQMRKETIEFLSKQLEKLDEAEKLLKKIR